MADKKKEAPKLIYESQESWYNQAVKAMNSDKLIVQFAFKIENYLKAAEMFDEVGDYLDAAELAAKCRELAEQTRNEEKEYRYQLAVNQKKQAKTAKGYEKAEKLFCDVLDYKDGKQQMEECQAKRITLEKQAKSKKIVRFGLLAVCVGIVVLFFMSPVWDDIKLRFLNGGKIEDPRLVVVETEKQTEKETETEVQTEKETKAETETESEKITVENAKPGDQVTFGQHLWYVLEADENQVKMILFQAEKYEELRHTPYNEEPEDVTWENCSLRKWLNSDFIEENFTEEERERIITVETGNDDNPTYGTFGGNTTQDKVSLLTAEEVEVYKDILKHIRMNIWLRTPGNSQDTAAFMASTNVAMDYGYPVDSEDFYTCPVIWVSR